MVETLFFSGVKITEETVTILTEIACPSFEIHFWIYESQALHQANLHCQPNRASLNHAAEVEENIGMFNVM